MTALRLAPLFLFVLVGSLSAQDYGLIRWHGQTKNRVNIVIVAEGYTWDEYDGFYWDAADLATGLMAQEPFQTYDEYVNVWYYFAPSNDSGTSGFPGEPTRDTYFGSQFLVTNPGDPTEIPRAMALSAAGTTLLNDALRDMADSQEATESRDSFYPIVLVNTTRYGGGASGKLVVMTRGDDDANLTTKPATIPPGTVSVAEHEFGHSFGNLGDEYSTPPYPAFPVAEYPNVTAFTISAGVRWYPWIPSPGSNFPGTLALTSNGVGHYQGAQYHPTGWYRAHYQDKMSLLSAPFGAVNKEQLIKRIYAHVQLIDGVYPDNSASITTGNPWGDPVPITGPQQVSFGVSTPVPNPTSLQYCWKVDGRQYPGNQSGFSIAADSLTYGVHHVSVDIRDDTRSVFFDDEGSSPLQQRQDITADTQDIRSNTMSSHHAWAVDIKYGGPNWTLVPIAFSPQRIVKGNGRYVASTFNGSSGPTASSGIITYGTTPLDWHPSSTSTGLNLALRFRNIAFANNRFFGLEYGSSVFSSVDGQFWNTSLTGLIPSNSQGYPSLAGGGPLVLVTDSHIPGTSINLSVQRVLSRVDGGDWVDLGNTVPFLGGVAGAIGGVEHMAYGNGYFVGVAGHEHRSTGELLSRATLLRSVDGTAWSRAEPPPTPGGPVGFTGVTFCNGNFFAFPAILELDGDTYRYPIWRSVDGVSWNSHLLPAHAATGGGHDVSMCYGNGTYLSVSPSGILRSSDGLAWGVEHLDLATLGVPGATLTGCWYERGRFYVYGIRGNLCFALVKSIAQPASFQSWKDAMFDTDELAAASVSSFLAAPAGDNIPNAMKFALGLVPQVNATNSLNLFRVRLTQSAITPQQEMVLEFRRPRTLAGIVEYQVEATDSLSPANWQSVSTTPEIDPSDIYPDPQLETVRITEPIAPATPRRFFRLKVTLLP